MRRKHALAIALFLTFVFFCSSPARAMLESDLDKAKGYIKAGRIPHAIELLKKRINKKPTDAVAHFLIATCYLMEGSYDLAEERFDSAVSLKPDCRNEIGKAYRKAADHAFKHNRLPIAGNLFDQALEYDPGLEKEAYNFFLKLGDAMGGVSAVTYYDKALAYTHDRDQQQQIGYRFLEIATRLSSGSQRETLKNRANALLGREKVDEVFSRPFKKTVFEKTYTDADIDPKTGNIVAFIWDDKFKKGDHVEIRGYIPAGAPEIAIYLGKNFSPEWKTTENGSLSYSIEEVPPAGSYYLVRIEQDIKFTLKISRTITPGPNEDLLSPHIN